MDEVFIKRKRTLVLDSNDINKMRDDPEYEAIVQATFRRLRHEQYTNVLIISSVPKSKLPKWMRNELYFEKISVLRATLDGN